MRHPVSSSPQVSGSTYLRSSQTNGGAGYMQNQGLTEPLLGKNPIPSYVQDPDTDVCPTRVESQHLKRGLSARQVQMIALAGTIGTGLFLGTGKSLAEGKSLSQITDATN